ncbi:PREDICTED: cytochrome P450 4c3-like [Polistes dominula]|uniref:Cytochrome P450 4c3-like n=1 Tax=Polistes dominula TaxID=743375 RepID=A0ABM1J0C9_POLDO|nr:PREDICTED: cytochrome P450 4c3-like [Polistes dominula]
MLSAIQIPDLPWTAWILSWSLIIFIASFIINHIIFSIAVWRIPHPKALPLIGNAYQLNCNSEEFFSNLIKWQEEYGQIYLIWVGMRAFIFLYRVETVKPLLENSDNIDKSLEYRHLIPWLGTGLITSNGEKWHSRRKLISSTFHKHSLEDYFSCAMNEVNIMINCLRKEIDKSVDIVPYAKRAALDVICDSSMGYRLDAQTTLYNEYVLAVDKLSHITQYRFTSLWASKDFLFKWSNLGKEYDRALRVVHNFVDQVIAERKRERGNNENNNYDKPTKRNKHLLDSLLDISSNGTILTDTDIRDEVNTFMFAGHDTTATSISWVLYALGRNPQYQQRILDEYDEIIGSDELTNVNIKTLRLLEACIKETWRMYPVAPLIARQIYKPIKILGVTVPAGATVLINSYLLHRDPQNFPEPDVYRPERFLSDNPPNSPYAFIPFSAGNRNCIGKNLAPIVVKVFIISILKAYHIESLIPEDKLRLKAELVLVNNDGVPLKITPRER